MKRHVLVLGMLVLAGCGARSALDPDDGGHALGGSPGVGAASADAGAPPVGGNGGSGGNGGDGPQGGEGPLCLPALCDASWEVTLPPQDMPGYPMDLATDPCGNAVLTTIDAEEGVWAAQLDPAGALKWARRVAPYQEEYGGGRNALVAGTPSGDVIVALTYEIGFSIDGVMVSNNAEIDIALMRFDGAGTLQWVKSFGTAETEIPTALAVTPDGDILLGGTAQTGLDLGGGQLDDALFLARFSSTGEHRWSYRFAETGAGPAAFAAAPNGDFWVLGRARRDVQFPGGPLFEGENFQDRIFIARLAEDGSEIFSSLYGDSNDVFLSSRGFNIGATPEGGARFVAAMTGTVDFGGGIVQIGQAPISSGVADVELAADGGFVSASQLVVPIGIFSSAIGPDGVFVGEPGSIVEYGTTVSDVLSFQGDDAPLLSRIDGGLVAARVQFSPQATSTVLRLCDGGGE